MTKFSLIVLMSLAVGAAYAQAPSGAVTMSTDPSKAAAVERHAQELQAQESKTSSSKAANTHESAHKSAGKTSKSSGKTAAMHKSHKSDKTKPPAASNG